MRLAAVATPENRAAWAKAGPPTAPARVAAAFPVRNTALTRPSTALGITRCTVASGITWDIEPNMPMPAAAGRDRGQRGDVHRAQQPGCGGGSPCVGRVAG